MNSACKTNLLVLDDVLPSAKQQDFNVSFKQSSLTDFALILNLTYKIRNPYKKDLPVPDHTMGIFIDGKNLGLAVEHIAVSIPANSSKEMKYEFNLNSELLKSLMGKNNEITFHSSIELDLTDFTSMLPNYQLTVTEDFDIETSKFKPLINNLIEKKIGKYNFEMEHSTHVKIPALPTISASSDPIEITLLGEGIDFINPNAIKEALIPFGDLLINGELDGLKDPFISAVVNSKVTIPTPTLLEWDKTVEIKMETQVINLLKPVIPGIENKWEDTKSLLYQDVTIPVTSYFVDNFLDPYVDSNASANWDIFQDGYNQLKTTVLPNEIPGPQTTGFEIAIPFTFKNNNEFPINIPVFRSSVFITDGIEPFTIYIKPKSVAELPLGQVPANLATIEAKTAETLYVIFSFNMEDFNQGIYSLFSGTPFEPNLKGVMSYDFGYGSMYVGYDLMGMELNYK